MIVKAIIFDLDGTLVETGEAHLNAWLEACRRFSLRNVTADEVRKHLGKTSLDIAQGLLSARGLESLEDAARLADLKDKIFAEKYAGTVTPIEGVSDVLNVLKSRGLSIAVVSSNPRRVILTMLKAANLAAYVDVIVGQDEVKKGKPDPEPILKSLERLKVDSREVLVVGDSVYDIEAATRAGVLAIGVTTGVSSPSQ
ncbi:MAG: hypothetical protein DRJ59_08280, partial [Thermoprotei archaeon]